MRNPVNTTNLCAFLFLILPAVLLMAGCTAAIQDAEDLHDSARAYVEAVHDARREIRRECWDILMEEVDALRDAGKHAEARARLAANYPPLVTIDVLESIENNPATVLSEPFGCQ